jgi:hypothetical protein
MIATMNRRSGVLNSLSSSKGGEGWREEANSLTIVGRFMESLQVSQTRIGTMNCLRQATLSHPMGERLGVRVSSRRFMEKASLRTSCKP